jgi:sec-independent protein translocase protein TatA
VLGLDNPIHIAFILVLLLLVFGAKRLPEMGRSLGEGLRGFKDSISGEPATAHLNEPSAAVTPVPAHAEMPARVDDARSEPVAEPRPLQPTA